MFSLIRKVFGKGKAMEDYILEMKGITKTFPGVVALNNVDINVKRCDVHALIGENGAGKSTLMKVLNGVYTANGGDIFLNGKKITISNTMEARKLGIGLIFQEFNLVNSLSAAENIYMNRLKKRMGRVDWKQINKDAQDLIDSLDFRFNVTEKVEKLSAAQKQLIEIAKVLTFEAKIIVMDEPTSSLTTIETAKLFKIIEQLKRNGITVIYISHKLDEIFTICDTATVMRDGEVIETRAVKDFTRAQIIESMVGRSVDMEYPRRSVIPSEVVLSVDKISRQGIIKDISFDLHKGEILGIAGLVGSGRTELAEALFGAEKYDGGVILINGKKVVIHSTYNGKKYGIGLLTEDRKETGLILSYDIMHNITVTNLEKIKIGPFLSIAKEKKYAAYYAKELNIKTPSIRQLAINLSGGNQQKVVFAKWLFSDVDILVLDEPTRGIDVGAKYEIYQLMNELVSKGKSIIMISSEMPEVLGMSDRIIVINAGSKKGELLHDEANPQAVMRMAIN